MFEQITQKVAQKVYNNVTSLIKLWYKNDTIFTTSEKSKTSAPDRIIRNLTDKANLKSNDKYVALWNLSIYSPWKIIRVIQKQKIKISAPIWYDKFELFDGLYFVSYIQEYFEYIIKKHETVADNPPIRIYVNKIENRITFKIKTRYYLEHLTPETVKTKLTKDENSENVSHLKITEVVLVHCNIFNNDYQQDSKVLHAFLPNKSIGQLLDITPNNFIFYILYWFRIHIYWSMVCWSKL